MTLTFSNGTVSINGKVQLGKYSKMCVILGESSFIGMGVCFSDQMVSDTG